MKKYPKKKGKKKGYARKEAPAKKGFFGKIKGKKGKKKKMASKVKKVKQIFRRV